MRDGEPPVGPGVTVILIMQLRVRFRDATRTSSAAGSQGKGGNFRHFMLRVSRFTWASRKRGIPSSMRNVSKRPRPWRNPGSVTETLADPRGRSLPFTEAKRFGFLRFMGKRMPGVAAG
jgi:hypothetical protein